MATTVTSGEEGEASVDGKGLGEGVRSYRERSGFRGRNTKDWGSSHVTRDPGIAGTHRPYGR